MRKAIAISVCLILCCFYFANAQEVGDAEQDTFHIRKCAPKLYIQNEAWIDILYIKTEITFVNYVRERKESDVHLIITSQYTGSGGNEYTLAFHGQKEFKDLNYELKYVSTVDATEDEIRESLTKTIKQGLVPFVSRTPLADLISIQFEEDEGLAEVKDRWNHWVFETEIRGYANGEKAHTGLWYSINCDVRRITEKQKFNIDGYYSFLKNQYTVGDNTLKATSKSYNSDAFYAYAFGEHFSFGCWSSYWRSKYNNYENLFVLTPAVECNIFPYSDYTRHEFIFQYRISYIYGDYYEETIYGKMQEKLFRGTLKTVFSTTECWGSVSISATGRHYYHDFLKKSLTIDGGVSLRLFAGLSLSFSGGYSIIRDQLSLRKGDATEEDVYLRLKEMETNYRYWLSFGISYTFGSIYSNIVNPRF